nr:hypothetical protein Itr_chr12CG28360 [Ipomoea trifida]
MLPERFLEPLPVPSFVVLKPVKHILGFNLPIKRQMGSYGSDLKRIGVSQSSPIKLLQHHQLLRRRTPSPGPARDFTTNHSPLLSSFLLVIIVIILFLFNFALMAMDIVGLNRWKKRFQADVFCRLLVLYFTVRCRHQQ